MRSPSTRTGLPASRLKRVNISPPTPIKMIENPTRITHFLLSLLLHPLPSTERSPPRQFLARLCVSLAAERVKQGEGHSDQQEDRRNRAGHCLNSAHRARRLDSGVGDITAAVKG